MSRLCIHATSLRLGTRGLLIRGASGSGKSTLARQLLAKSNAALISDDYTDLCLVNRRLIASAPAQLRGLLEIRGKGIEPWPSEPSVLIHLVVDLLPLDQIDRLPDPETLFCTLQGMTLPRQPVPTASDTGPFGATEALIEYRLKRLKSEPT